MVSTEVRTRQRIGPAGQISAPIGGVSTLVVCDDFTTDVSPETAPWLAVVTDVASLSGETTASTNVKFDQTNSSQQVCCCWPRI